MSLSLTIVVFNSQTIFRYSLPQQIRALEKPVDKIVAKIFFKIFDSIFR